MEDSRQSRKHGVSLLLHRRKIAADAAKSGDPSRTAKGARNLLLNFRPAKVPLGLVVGKRKTQVVEQSQHLLGTPKQRIQQILGLTLLGPAFGRSCRRGGVGALNRPARRPHPRTTRNPDLPPPSGDPAPVAPHPPAGSRLPHRANSP